MKYYISDILEAVRVTLDQNQEETILLEDADTLQLNTLIREKIEECALWVNEHAALEQITEVKEVVSSDGADDRGELTILLPGDWLRLKVAKMQDWKIPVRIAVSDVSDVALMRWSDYKGIRPTTLRPMAVETEIADGRALVLCGSEENAKLEYARYVPIPKIAVESGTDDEPPVGEDPTDNPGTETRTSTEDAEYMDFTEQLYPSLVNRIAGVVAVAWQDQRAKDYVTISSEYIAGQEQ